MSARACILRADGTNCDAETVAALRRVGGRPRIVHVNELRAGITALARFDLLVIPGGFSYGDDVASGAILAVELMTFLRDQLSEFAAAGKPIVGICNGFQVLVRCGLLPLGAVGPMTATLARNDSGRFECRWVRLRIEPSPCVFWNGLPEEIELPVAHGEGKVLTGVDASGEIGRLRLVPLRYADRGASTVSYPLNPNGSPSGIASVCDPSGRIFGLMPHPERFVERWQHPNWRRARIAPYGLSFFENLVKAAT